MEITRVDAAEGVKLDITLTVDEVAQLAAGGFLDVDDRLGDIGGIRIGCPG